MSDMHIRRICFEMERIAYSQRLSNTELEALEDVGRRGIIVEMTRRLAVNRQMFEDKERPPEVTRKVETVSVSVKIPSSWWEHAKRDVPILRWLRRAGLLKLRKLQTFTEQKRLELERTERHYIQVVTILDDQKEIPAHQRSIEIKYQVEKPRRRESSDLERLQAGEFDPARIVNPDEVV